MTTPTLRRGLLSLLLWICPHHAAAQQQPQQGPWQRHTIDDTSVGADGVRLGDINGDGLQDIVTGWEEGGITRLYLNPGPDAAREPWPAVTVGPARNVEDAVLVDLDSDGTLDVVSSCEGNTRTMFVHWGPSDHDDLLDPEAWITEPIAATVGLQQWMYCEPVEADGEHGIDLVVGSKGSNAAVGWLESPEDPRDLDAWQYHRVCDAGWIMSIQAGVFHGTTRLLITDRRGPTRGIYFLTPPAWDRFVIEEAQAEYMFGQVISVDSEVAHAIITAATRDGHVSYAATAFDPDGPVPGVQVPNPFATQAGKASSIGYIDADRTADLVLTFNTQRQPDLPGVAWVHVDPDLPPEQWPAYDISGPEGAKFDRIELIDMDGDGDLDVLTCEEIDQLGVIWYENPFGTAE